MTHGAAFAVTEELAAAFQAGASHLKVSLVAEEFQLTSSCSGDFNAMLWSNPNILSKQGIDEIVSAVLQD